MQLNGSIGPMTVMAASEPPEPPPRNPDKINASLNKHASDTKSTKSLDNSDKSLNNNKPFKSILSVDGTISSFTIATSIESSTDNSWQKPITNNSNADSELATIEALNVSPVNGDEGSDAKSNVIPGDENSTSPLDASTIEHNKSNGGKIDLTDISIIKKRNDDLVNEIKNESDDMQIGRSASLDIDNQSEFKLRQENERLTNEIIRLKELLDGSQDGAVGGVDLSDSNSMDAHSTDGSSSRIERLESELKLAKEQISQLKNERKRLKADKIDLLAHVKQLCASLQDKEQELRDFIRNYEHRIRETESTNAKISTDRERERWSLLKHARDESERSLSLAAQLNARDIQLQRIQEQLQEARRQLSGCMSDQESLLSFAPLTPPSGMISQIAGPSSGFGSLTMTERGGSCSADSGVRGSSDKDSAAGDYNLSDGPSDNGPCITVDSDSISIVSSHHNMYQFGTPKERSPTLSPLNAGAFSRSIDSGTLSRSVEQLGSPVDTDGPPVLRRIPPKTNTGTLGSRSGRGGTWGSISRVFARTKNRNKSNQVDSETSDFQWSPLTEEGYAEKLRLLREASSIPIERWRASQVLAWLEVALGMPQYSTRCSENVKSGKVLLELNDGELESGLGLTHPMHRKKLRLAIEEQRRPELIRYPTIGQLGHT